MSKEGRARRASVRRAFQVSAGLVPWAALKLLFVLSPGASDASDAELNRGDVFLAPGCTDSDGSAHPTAQSATTCKVLAALGFVAKSYQFHFFVRSGDDSHFRVDQLLLRVAPVHVGSDKAPAVRNFVMGSWLHSTPDNPFNNVEDDAQRRDYGLWCFPNYPSGMGYVFSEGVARGLAALHASIGLKDGYPEDGVVGLWLAGLSITSVSRIDSPCFYNFNAESTLGKCRDDGILVHYMTPGTWDLVDASGRLPARCAMEST